jgi:hypothetical protein
VANDVLAALDRFDTDHVTLVGGPASLGAEVLALKRC